ncbi:MAG: 1-(5-phosphoribosyl)-5-[(5-phosphoribosylamino)methylideneamino] imidazole-4-carboxamide isomerase [Longimicrobiales bacterium]|nr:1-(5-phosphoribosyl)-5-[(5-phosphoribosylamino)methylideneamino] imidazole-4-carboxamide isomerase [Longimicrobiales bacterium]
MIAIPAVDLRGGRCVQLVGGRPEDERVSLPDPVEVARQWWELGFHSLHVVDLDAALGSGENLSVVRDVAAATPAVTQVGGGVRDDHRIDDLLASGVDRVVVGTRALADPRWLGALTRRQPGRVVVAADTRDAYVVTRGWTERAGPTIADFLERLEGLPLAGILATDAGMEGRMQGMDRRAVARTLRWSTHPVMISGGVTTEEDLAWLEDAGAYGAVLGMALYTGTLDAARVGARWGGNEPSGGTS